MKFSVNTMTGKPVIRQFESVRVACSDKVMAEVLSMLPGTSVPYAEHRYHDIRRMRKDGGGELMMFRSGAKLHVSRERTGFSIYCYHYSGADGHAAIAELKIGYGLRDLQKQSDIMWGACGSFLRTPKVGIEFKWPPK